MLTQISNPWFRFLLITVIVLALVGCARQLAYRFADTYLMWQARAYVSLEREQRRALRHEINELLQWHAQHEMPQYRQLLDELATDMGEQRLDGSRFDYYQQQGAARWFAIQEAALAPALRLLPTLSDGQVDELIESLAEKIQERADTFAEQSVEERREEGAQSFAKQLKRWLGEVTDEQQALIDVWAAQMPDMAALWIEYRVIWAEAFRAALATRDDAEIFAERLQPLFTDPEALRPEALVERAEKSQALTRDTLLQIEHSLTAQQRAHFVEHAQDFRSDLASMMQSRGVKVQ